MTLFRSSMSRAFLAAVIVLTVTPLALAAQRGGRGGVGPAQDPNLPEEPTAVALPRLSSPVMGPGTMYQSVQSLPPGLDLDHYDYEAVEYLVEGTAAGEPYKTRIVLRKPRDNDDFSGLVFAEAMHPSGSAHIFEYTSHYAMGSGHAAVEIVVSGLNHLTDHDQSRYSGVSVSGDQVSEVLAQVGALIKEGPSSPLAGLEIRKMVLGGTSATAAILTRYLPAHGVYRTPGMELIFDGFMPHSNGATIQRVDVPLIQVPTMNEVSGGNVPTRQDGDEPGNQYRLYEFAGMMHVDMRDSVRFKPDPCQNPITMFPLQAYLSVALDHLFRWADEGLAPPHAPRILLDRNTENDGSLMALDAHGNPIGGVRNPYVDVATALNGVPNTGAATLPANPSDFIAAGGIQAANQMCGLGGYQLAFSEEKMRQLYGTPENYVRQVQAKLDELEAVGWSLPVYREMILSDAEKIDF
jgi:hypothetical protein